MIEIRQGIFETNSSSCHVFVYRPDEDVNIPSTVTLHPNSDDTILDTLFNDYYRWWDYDQKLFHEQLVFFLSLLKVLGVQKVICSDNRVEEFYQKLVNDEVERSYRPEFYIHHAEAYKHILFGADVKVTTIPDDCGLDFDEEVEQKFGKGYDYISIRLS